MFYTQMAGTFEQTDMESLLRSACELIGERDQGSLSLDARKGLVQLQRKGKQRPEVV